MKTTIPRFLFSLAVLTWTAAGAFAADEGEIPPPKTEPRVIEPGPPPSDAIILFDGTDLAQWKSAKDGGPAKWEIKDGIMTVNGTGSISTKREFGDCQLHVEWASPAEVKGEGQGRGNSGIYLQGRYEVQILDSFENKTYYHGQAGAIYKQHAPLVNASRPPGEWQTYDIIWEAPKFEGDKLTKPAFVTVIHNGVVLHHHKEVIGRMAHRKVGTYAPHGAEEPLALQDHDTPVHYRNIWVRRLGGYDQS